MAISIYERLCRDLDKTPITDIYSHNLIRSNDKNNTANSNSRYSNFANGAYMASRNITITRVMYMVIIGFCEVNTGGSGDITIEEDNVGLGDITQYESIQTDANGYSSWHLEHAGYFRPPTPPTNYRFRIVNRSGGAIQGLGAYISMRTFRI